MKSLTLLHQRSFHPEEGYRSGLVEPHHFRLSRTKWYERRGRAVRRLQGVAFVMSFVRFLSSDLEAISLDELIKSRRGVSSPISGKSDDRRRCEVRNLLPTGDRVP